jgi:hypothetical protein
MKAPRRRTLSARIAFGGIWTVLAVAYLIIGIGFLQDRKSSWDVAGAACFGLLAAAGAILGFRTITGGAQVDGDILIVRGPLLSRRIRIYDAREVVVGSLRALVVLSDGRYVPVSMISRPGELWGARRLEEEAAALQADIEHAHQVAKREPAKLPPTRSTPRLFVVRRRVGISTAATMLGGCGLVALALSSVDSRDRIRAASWILGWIVAGFVSAVLLLRLGWLGGRITAALGTRLGIAVAIVGTLAGGVSGSWTGSALVGAGIGVAVSALFHAIRVGKGSQGVRHPLP